MLSEDFVIYKCLIIIKIDNLIKKSDIEIKKLYNKIKGRK